MIRAQGYLNRDATLTRTRQPPHPGPGDGWAYARLSKDQRAPGVLHCLPGCTSTITVERSPPTKVDHDEAQQLPWTPQLGLVGRMGIGQPEVVGSSAEAEVFERELGLPPIQGGCLVGPRCVVEDE